MAWVRQTPREVDALFAALRERDPFGHRLHSLTAIAACFFAAFPTTWLEWAWWPALVVCLVRMISHHRILGPLVWEWPVRLTIAWVGFGALSLVWTAGTREAWLAEWGVARYALFILALWPVMNERRWLIAALASGVVVGNLSQVGQMVGQAAGIEWLVWPRLEDRNSGWWDPVVGGSILCAALGLHLAALLLGRSVLERVVGGVLCAATLAAVAATGTRGAWIGAAGVVGFAIALMGWRALIGRGTGPVDTARSEVQRRGVLIGAVVVVMCIAAVWVAAGTTIAKRVGETREELARAMEGDYQTFTGARLAMWGWAGRAAGAHPVRGVGAGGYQAWVEEEMRRDAAVSHRLPPRVHSHAHSMVLHAAAVSGVVGAGLLVWLVLTSVWWGLVSAHGWARGYDAGPGLAMVGLVCAGLFDTIQVNQQTAYWMWLVVAMCMRLRPRSGIAEVGAT